MLHQSEDRFINAPGCLINTCVFIGFCFPCCVAEVDFGNSTMPNHTESIAYNPASVDATPRDSASMTNSQQHTQQPDNLSVASADRYGWFQITDHNVFQAAIDQHVKTNI